MPDFLILIRRDGNTELRLQSAPTIAALRTEIRDWAQQTVKPPNSTAERIQIAILAVLDTATFTHTDPE